MQIIGFAVTWLANGEKMYWVFHDIVWGTNIVVQKLWEKETFKYAWRHCQYCTNQQKSYFRIYCIKETGTIILQSYIDICMINGNNRLAKYVLGKFSVSTSSRYIVKTYSPTCCLIVDNKFYCILCDLKILRRKL